jgi:hypothetical protein
MKGLGFKGSPAEQAIYSSEKNGRPSDRRSAATDGREWLGRSWARFWPMRVRRAGRFGGLPVDCWAASPGGSREAVVGQISFAGQKECCAQ